MADKTEVVSIRLPKDLLTKVDDMVEQLGFSTSRADYVVKSLDSFFRLLVDTKLKIDKQIEQLKELHEIDPNTILSITKAAMDIYMKKYGTFTENKQQILLRVPTKMNRAIDEYRTYLGLYTDRSEFIRFAVVNQIGSDTSLLERMNMVRENRIFQERTTDDIVNSVLKELQNSDSDALNGLVGLTKLFLDKSAKPKE